MGNPRSRRATMNNAVAQVEYRDVPGWPGYRVGDDGSVWSLWKRRGLGRGTATYLSDT